MLHVSLEKVKNEDKVITNALGNVEVRNGRMVERMITSNTNQQIKHIIKLQKSSRLRKETGTFIVEGTKMIEEAMKCGLVKKVYICEGNFEKVKEDLSLESIDYEVIVDSVFHKITETVTPQGTLAVARMPFYTIGELTKEKPVNFLILDDIQDPGNLGTMIRTAEGAGFTALVMSKGTVDVFNQKVVRSTMGALFRVPFIYVDNLQETLLSLQSEGVTLFATALDANNMYDEETYNGNIGILIGNEGNGLKQELIDMADRKIRIPMGGKLESLNAAISAAILMYEVNRQYRMR